MLLDILCPLTLCLAVRLSYVHGRSDPLCREPICQTVACAYGLVFVYSRMPYSAMKIANYFFELGQKEKIEITPLKLQKLLYFAHGWHLVLDSEGTPLLNESIEAWRYGPVVPSVYHEFKNYRDEPIPGPFLNFDDDYNIDSSFELSDEERCTLGKFLTSIWNEYGSHTGMQLSQLTHASGSPWRGLYDKYKGDIPRRKKIDNQSIKRHFQDKWERSQNG